MCSVRGYRSSAAVGLTVVEGQAHLGWSAALGPSDPPDPFCTKGQRLFRQTVIQVILVTKKIMSVQLLQGGIC